MVLGHSTALSYSRHRAKKTMSASTPTPAIAIRLAVDKDAPKILACLQAAFAPYRDFYSPAAYLDTVLSPETLRERFTQMQVFVAETSSGEIAGTIACQAIYHAEGHLRGMAVLPNYQGAGIAAQLLSHAEIELRRQNCSRITLDTTAPLKRAARFYENFGFRRSGKVSDFFGMPLFEYEKRLPTKE